MGLVFCLFVSTFKILIFRCFKMQLLGILNLRNAYSLPHCLIYLFISIFYFFFFFFIACCKVYVQFVYYFGLRCEFIIVLLWESKKFYWIMWGPHNGDPIGITLFKFVKHNPLEVFCEKGVLKNLKNSLEHTCVKFSLLTKVADETFNFINKKNFITFT